MLCFDMFFRWALKDYKIAKKRRHRRHDIEMQKSIGQDVTDGRIDPNLLPPTEPSKRPLIYVLISFWAYFENLALILVIIIKCSRTKNTEHFDNFLNGFCTGSNCEDGKFVLKALFFKAFTSLFFFIGSNTVSFVIHF